MQIDYQTTKKDYIAFFLFSLKQNIRNKPVPFALAILFLAYCAFINNPTNSSYSWEGDTFNFVLSLFLLCVVVYAIVYIRIIYLLYISAKTAKSYTDSKTITITNEGLNVLYQTSGAITTVAWDMIGSVGSSETFVYGFTFGKKPFFIPIRYFASDSEVSAFINEIQTRRLKNSVWAEKQLTENSKPPYWMGWFGLIPLIGAFVGAALVINGIVKYKNARLVLAGIAGIAFTVIVYSLLIFGSTSDTAVKGFVPFAQSDLNNLMKNIEFYKLQHGDYPDSLGQLKTKTDLISIDDPIQIMRTKKVSQYNYQKMGNKYYLFSSGVDGIPHTADDIYPQLAPRDTTKFGLILK